MTSSLPTPWGLAGIVPALPVRYPTSLDASAAPVAAGLRPAAAIALRTPWTADAVRLPARADALPVLAGPPVLPVPRDRPDLIDLREPAALRR